MDRQRTDRGARRARSPAMVSARRLFAVHHRSELTGAPPAEILGELEAQRAHDSARAREVDGRTRRELLIGAGGLATGAALGADAATALAWHRAGAPARPQ